MDSIRPYHRVREFLPPEAPAPFGPVRARRSGSRPSGDFSEPADLTTELR